MTVEYYASHGPAILANERVDINGAEAWVAHERAGLVLAVMPWNFAASQVMRFAILSLVAGNGILLKHASNVTGSALAPQILFLEWGGFPQRIAALTLTGSNRAGAAVGAEAGRAATFRVVAASFDRARRTPVTRENPAPPGAVTVSGRLPLRR